MNAALTKRNQLKVRKVNSEKEAKGFIKKIGRQPFALILEDDLSRMQAYKCALIDEMLYPQKSDTIAEGQLLKDKFLIEIKNVDRWLKIQATTFVNDNNRNFAA